MKIVPYTKNWNDGKRDWSYVDDPSSAIKAWRKSTGLTLPFDYEHFILKYNGGRVYPRRFKHNIGPINSGPYIDESRESYIDLFFPWSLVESHWRGETYGNGTPPGYLLIAENPGGIYILLSLELDSYGEVFSWVHSTDIWGTDRNTKIYPQADSFSNFLNSLYDIEDKSDYDNWRLPIYDQLQRDLEF